MSSSPETVFKVVVTGPFAAGKTTFVETVVEREFVTMAASTTSNSEVRVKRATTIGMDFGVLTLADPDGDVELRIYGTPGQERFSFMWEVLAEGADAFVLVVNGQDEASWMNARAHHAVMERVGIPGVLAVNRSDDQIVERAQAYFSDLPVRVMGCQANDIEDVKAVLVATLVAILQRLEHGGALVEAPVGGPVDTTFDPFGDLS
jgi:uncharacterized protein